jgi:enoyl reductase
MSRKVQFAEFGSLDVLTLVEVPEPQAEEGQVRVRVLAAGINPVDYKIVAGSASAQRFDIAFPSGNGNDFAGVVDQVGAGVSEFAVGDAVAGGRRFFAQADYVVVDPARLATKPDGVSFEVAGALDIAARTAWQSVESMDIAASDTVLVSSAAGGVGGITAQLLLRKGATVVGTAGDRNHAFLRSRGILPVAYGDGLIDRVRAVAPTGITAVFDTHGEETIFAGLRLGVPADRINTTAAKYLKARLGIGTVGQEESDPRGLSEVLALIACGAVQVPIEAVFPLKQVVEAYTQLAKGHTRGKIVLVTA